MATKVLRYVRDPAVATWKKASGLLAAAYVVWPIDLIPDVPGIGWLDDIGVMGAFTFWMMREIKRHSERQAQLPPVPPPDAGKP